MSPSPLTPSGAPATKARRGVRLLKGAGLGALAVVVALLCGELAYRAFDGEPLPDVIGPRYLFERDPELGIRLRPGFRGTHETHEFSVEVAIDSLGLRDREVGDLPADALRILSLGDSFVYGFGVRAEETFSRRMEEELARERPVRVFDAGVPSYGTRHELLFLRRLAPRLQPDLVLLTFFFANDLQDNVSPNLTERGGIVLSSHFAGLVDSSRFYTFALEHSDLLTLGIVRWIQFYYGYPVPDPPSRPPADPRAVIETGIGVEMLATPASEEIETAWRTTASLLRDVRDATEAAGARLAIIDVPLQYQFDDELWGRICARHGLASEDFDRRVSALRLREIATELGVPFLELADTFAAVPDASTLYFAINKHFSAAGHDVAGRAIAEFLTREGLVDG